MAWEGRSDQVSRRNTDVLQVQTLHLTAMWWLEVYAYATTWLYSAVSYICR